MTMNGWLTVFLSVPFLFHWKRKYFFLRSIRLKVFFGVFADSLPDGWGRLLVDRLMLRNQINPHEIGSLDRLSIVGAPVWVH